MKVACECVASKIGWKMEGMMHGVPLPSIHSVSYDEPPPPRVNEYPLRAYGDSLPLLETHDVPQ